MGQLQNSVFYRNQIISVVLGLVLVGLALATLPVQAQSGCVGDPCLFYTPTGTATRTPSPTPMTGTATAVPMPGATPFPRPFYGIPTGIPNINFPTVPPPLDIDLPTPEPLTATPSPWPMPSPITGSILPTAGAPISPSTVTPPENSTAVPLATIDTNLVISYSALQPLTATGMATSGTFADGLNGEGRGIISDMVSYTNYLTGEINRLQYSDTFTMYTAPDWYAPYLPREMANIGWTFEQYEGSNGRYGLTTWAWLFGTMIAMPVKLTNALFELLKFMGPFGLFMIWLVVIMLPAVLGFKILVFIKNTFIRLINFALQVLDWILKLWQSIPWYLGGPG